MSALYNGAELDTTDEQRRLLEDNGFVFALTSWGRSIWQHSSYRGSFTVAEAMAVIEGEPVAEWKRAS